MNAPETSRIPLAKRLGLVKPSATLAVTAATGALRQPGKDVVHFRPGQTRLHPPGPKNPGAGGGGGGSFPCAGNARGRGARGGGPVGFSRRRGLPSGIRDVSGAFIVPPW